MFFECDIIIIILSFSIKYENHIQLFTISKVIIPICAIEIITVHTHKPVNVHHTHILEVTYNRFRHFNTQKGSITSTNYNNRHNTNLRPI